ncbi:hypothetical protein J6590_092921 [Homalodisca vitripennis]|nr:hypothetical protein J6590_092921 [Homalodisca vitripennis]
MNSTLEVLNEHGANPMNKPIALRSSDSLSGLGISANLLGVHAGEGLDHDRRGYDNMCQGFSAKPAGDYYNVDVKLLHVKDRLRYNKADMKGLQALFNALSGGTVGNSPTTTCWIFPLTRFR